MALYELSDEQVIDIARVVSVGGLLANQLSTESPKVVDLFRFDRATLRRTSESANNASGWLNEAVRLINLKMSRAN